MTVDLMPFDYEGQTVRTVVIDGEPWFVLADLCAILGLDASAVRRRLDDGVIASHPILDSLGRIQQATVVSEPGMYEVVIRSDKPEAVTFRRWITGTVLPQIRRTGSYGIAPALTEDQIVAQALQITARRVEELEQRVTELEPPAQAWEHLASTDGDLSVNEAAKVLSRDPAIVTGERRLWKWMDQHRWTYRDAAGDRRAYQGRIESGHLGTRARSHHHPGTGELVIDAPQVRVTMAGIELLRRHLSGGQLTVVPA